MSITKFRLISIYPFLGKAKKNCQLLRVVELFLF
jgi:hypothetical protein